MTEPNLIVETVASIAGHVRARAAAALAALGVEAPNIDLAPPPNPAMGDLGFPCFAFAKQLRKAPPVIAKDVAQQMLPDALIQEIVTDNAYVNVRLNPTTLGQLVLREVHRERERYGAGQAAPRQAWMVEYSAPNTNKPLHLGHLRNNVLGSSIARVLRFYGHEVTRINLVNDRGVHICKSMLAYQRYGAGVIPETFGKKGDHLVGHFYVRFDQEFSKEYAAWQSTPAATEKLAAWQSSKAGEKAIRAAAKDAEKDPQNKPAKTPAQLFFGEVYKDTYFNNDSPLGTAVREMLLKWEDGDADVRALWRKLNDWVLAGFEVSYQRMGVGFEHTQYESETYKLGKSIVDEGLSRGVLERIDGGAVVCDLAKVGLSGQKVLLRSDGTSVYMTQDLGTAAERFDRFHIDRIVYVVGDEQNYHFQVLFKILGLLRPGLSEACYHLGYGMIRLPDGKMKSREGTVVDADNLMDEMHALAREETLARVAEGKAHTEGLSPEELEHRAEHIAMAALKYFLLKYTPKTSFEYNPKESIDFLGQTGPYCLFNYARTRSLLRKAGREPVCAEDKVARLGTDREREIVRLLMNFPEVVARAATTLDPSRIAEYLFELSKSFAFIFTDKANHPIATCEDEMLRDARLILVAAIGHVLKAGLGLLGIEVLEEM